MVTHSWSIHRYIWYGVGVEIINLRICKLTGFKIADLTGKFPDKFYPATVAVPFSIIKKQKINKIDSK